MFSVSEREHLPTEHGTGSRRKDPERKTLIKAEMSNLGPPVAPFHPVLGEGAPKIDYRLQKKRVLVPLFQPLYWRTYSN